MKGRELIHSIKFVQSFINRLGGFGVLFSKAKGVLRDDGFKGIGNKIRHVFRHACKSHRAGITDLAYRKWIKKYDISSSEEFQQLEQVSRSFAAKPLISIIIPTFNTNPVWLKEAIESVRMQIYPNWELCIADDASTKKETLDILKHYQEKDERIHVVFRSENGHISLASNSALEMATGEYIALLDHDDLLAKEALFRVAETISHNPDAALLYSDEDKIDSKGKRSDPYFKCDWNYQLFLSQNMISHLGVYKSEIIKKTGGFRLEYEGSQDYDLALRFIEQIKPEQILHIPRVLYHWRIHNESTASGSENKPYAIISGQKSIAAHLHRKGIIATVDILKNNMYRVKYQLPETLPLVSIIIPSKNNLLLLQKCISSILDKTDYLNYEIIIIDNNSDDPALLKYLDKIDTNPKLTILFDRRPFNYSAINNMATLKAKGDFLLFLNDDTEVLNPDWLGEMISIASQAGVGIVGARLWYPNDTLQHGGVFLGVGGVGSHAHNHLPKTNHGYFERAVLLQEFSAVTAACLLVKKSLFEEVNGFDETNLSIAFNDVDFCLKVKALGHRIVWTPYAELYHHESVSRGDDFTAEKWERFSKENEFMLNKWGKIIHKDPAYSPNLSLKTSNINLAWPPRINNNLAL